MKIIITGLLLFIFITNLQAAKTNSKKISEKEIKAKQVEFEAAQESAKKRLLVIIDSKIISIDSFTKKLPKGISLLSAQNDLLVVASETEITKENLSNIKKIPGVLATRMDSVAVPRASTKDASACSKNTNAKPLVTDIKKITAQLAKKCELTEFCPDGKARYWAYDALDTDLMKTKTNELLKGTNITANVAVVDSGFDRAQEKNYSTVGQIKTAPGVTINEKHIISDTTIKPPKEGGDVIGNPNTDESGHGTMVASTIAGSGKLGVAENVALTVYRVTAPGETGSTSTAFIEMATYKACLENRDPDGLTVINVSWGGRIDEAGFKRDEDDEVTKKLLAKYAEMGCLVVKAAGNDSFRNGAPVNLDDAYLKVGAIDYYSELSTFSSLGEVNAPGSDIFVLESTTAKEKAEDESRCEPSDKLTASLKRFVNGTSFAAPITAGIASQVIRVLKNGERFKNLLPNDRIKIVNHILSTSMFNNSINGLRAVEIAANWNKAWQEATPADKQTKALLHPSTFKDFKDYLSRWPDQICSSSALNCSSLTECLALKDCYAKERKKAALCENLSKDVITDLARTALSNGYFEAAARYNRLEKTNGDLKLATETTELALRARLSQLKLNMKDPNICRSKYDMKYKMDYHMVKSLVTPYIHDCTIKPGKCDPVEIANMFAYAMSTKDVMSSLAKGEDIKTGEDRGSRDTLEMVKSLITDARIMIGDTKVGDILSAQTNHYLKNYYIYNYETSIIETSPAAYGRVLNELITTEKGETPFKKTLLALESKILTKVMTLNDRFNETTSVLSIGGFEDYPVRQFFDGMMERNKDIIDSAIKANNLETLAPVQIAYLLKKIDSDPFYLPKKTETMLSIFDRIFNGKGWGPDSNEDFVNTMLAILEKDMKGMTSPEKDSIKTRFSHLLNNAIDTNSVTEFATNYHNDRPINFDSSQAFYLDWEKYKPLLQNALSYKKHPLLSDGKVMREINLRSFYSIINKNDSDFEKFIKDKNDFFVRETLNTIIFTDDKSFNIFTNPIKLVKENKNKNQRLNPPTQIDRNMVAIPFDKSKSANELFARVLRGVKNKPSEFRDSLLYLMLEAVGVTEITPLEKQYIATLPKNGEWYTLAKELTQTDKTNGLDIYLLKKFMADFDRINK